MNNAAPIRCIVVDDEPHAVKLLANYVNKTPGLQLVLETTHVMKALQVVQEENADLIFLDIQMPDLTGIQFMKIIGNTCKVILTTAYAEYALEGYEHDVVDYLLKPVTFERFMIAVQKAKERLEKRTDGSVAPRETIDHIFIKSGHRIQKIVLSSIMYIEGLRDYIAIHTASGKLLSLENMRNIEKVLPAHKFIRIHKSYIIHKDKIDFLERGKVVINKQYLPVGERYRDKFMEWLKVV